MSFNITLSSSNSIDHLFVDLQATHFVTSIPKNLTKTFPNKNIYSHKGFPSARAYKYLYNVKCHCCQKRTTKWILITLKFIEPTVAVSYVAFLKPKQKKVSNKCSSLCIYLLEKCFMTVLVLDRFFSSFRFPRLWKKWEIIETMCTHLNW